MARALEVPLYQLFYHGEEPPKLPHLAKRVMAEKIAWGSSGKDARLLTKLRRLLGRVDESDRQLLLHVAQKMAGKLERTLLSEILECTWSGRTLVHGNCRLCFFRSISAVGRRSDALADPKTRQRLPPQTAELLETLLRLAEVSRDDRRVRLHVELTSEMVNGLPGAARKNPSVNQTRR